jgi:glucokinase
VVTVLAGDIGGTNSRFALYRDLEQLFERTYPSAEHHSLEAVVQRFLEDAAAAPGGHPRPERACLAVAGPVDDGVAKITNLTWSVDERQLAAATGISSVRLVNDFEAAASGVPLVGSEHLIPQGGGPREPEGPVVVVGPGTGLGMAFLMWSRASHRHEVVASEGGHADFAPGTALERGLAAHLTARYGHVSSERVISGPGLRNIFAFLLDEPAAHRLTSGETAAAMEREDGAAVIVRQAVSGGDPLCLLAVNIFASALGALAGNLALTVLATGGVFITGGIVPRLAPLFARLPLRQAFEAKGRLGPVVSRIPLHVVTHPEVGLLGAAALARRARG